MTVQEAILNFGYDPTIKEDGPTLRPPIPASLPSAATVNALYLPPPKAQGTPSHVGSPGSCAAWATTYGLATYWAAVSTGEAPLQPVRQASPAHIYIEVMKSYGKTGCAGSQLASYLNLLKQRGTPNWKTAPYFPNCPELWSRYDPGALPDDSFQIPGWATVETSDLDAIKAVIVAGGALCYGTSLNKGFMQYEGPGPLRGPLEKLPNTGHCMLIIGYDDEQQAILIQNSFGENWGCEWNGRRGYIWMGYELFQCLAQGQAMYITG
ncbi:hypothetical protein N182_10700 [Sinorhizobium sp. GL2]|nr:hypothetical protein N182_10700 [Sinorhizobium sp. GL2]